MSPTKVTVWDALRPAHLIQRAREAEWWPITEAVLLVSLASMVTSILVWYWDFNRGSIIFLIPVLITAARWGAVPALIASLLGLAASTFFFYEPVFTFWVSDPREYVNLALFICVAVVISQMATRLKQQALAAQHREIEMRDLYAFSRRLAAAFAAAEIHDAIEDHLNEAMQRKVVLFSNLHDKSGKDRSASVPVAVARAVQQVANGTQRGESGNTVKDENGHSWLVRAISPQNAEFGIIAVEFGAPGTVREEEDRIRVEQVLADAKATLERLGVANVITEARMRSQTEKLREALIGSVSHELRTPLAAILGAATVLTTAPQIASDKRLSGLANAVRDEAERLNHDIQNLLDATRISSDGLNPRSEWTDPADLINSAAERCRRRLGERDLVLQVPQDLPLIYADSALLQQALVQVLDNAIKYSPPHSRITLTAEASANSMALRVVDRGMGLTEEELPNIWDRFFRGRRHAATTSGSGLGLWIARAFVDANGGKITAHSMGPGMGTTFSIELPVIQIALPQLEAETDE